ncbi:MAG TPA: replication-relaxation family protein [Thermoanaerobaculia bacterium]|nr:replication-relaxation family protein [Thermoanaerobaculia bacterium]
MHDPRRAKPPSPRDVAALTFIGEGYEVAQYQLHAAIFSNVSAVVVSHFVTRAVRNGWIAVERWNRVGINRLRLTTTGREVVVRAGGDTKYLFVPRRPVAMKDVAHTLWINDVRVALGDSGVAFDALLPAWQLQRRLRPPPDAIPDLLAIRKALDGSPPLILACEIDLGGERLARTFFPKLRNLQRLVSDWSDGGGAEILVLTRGAQRAAAIKTFARAQNLSLFVTALPSAGGAEAVRMVRTIVAAVLARHVKSI